MKKSEMNQTHRDKIDSAVNSAFNFSDWAFAGMLAGGLSPANLYKISINDHIYVVRISDPEHPHHQLEREFAAMTAAANNHIAPQVHYANSQTGVLIMPFIADQSIYSFNLENPQQLERLAQFIYKFHQLPSLPPDDSIAKKLDGLLALFKPNLQINEIVQKCMALKDELTHLLVDEGDKRPCHCDINPTNLLYDGNQLWLIDWASASQQSFYFDLACASTFLFYQSEDANDAFLQAYFQRPPTSIEAKKYYLMRQFVAIYYGLIFVFLGVQDETTFLTQTEIDGLPTYPHFMQMLGEGKENLANARSRQKMGFIHLKSVLTAQKTARFADAIEGL